MMRTRLPMVFPHGVMLLRAIIGPTRSRGRMGIADLLSDLSFFRCRQDACGTMGSVLRISVEKR